ncbi:hypothetical protein EYF80_010590 [Liparis tanakae]|uniref:Uncharacterized protein n=1 Tax=Liparis tanakae TaxID=230148 RepID=A0A4Z2IPK0_9TELE|nr:hypothetical protein EYF80_010590 [Liparis tanakae]
MAKKKKNKNVASLTSGVRAREQRKATPREADRFNKFSPGSIRSKLLARTRGLFAKVATSSAPRSESYLPAISLSPVATHVSSCGSVLEMQCNNLLSHKPPCASSRGGKTRLVLTSFSKNL